MAILDGWRLDIHPVSTVLQTLVTTRIFNYRVLRSFLNQFIIQNLYFDEKSLMIYASSSIISINTLQLIKLTYRVGPLDQQK